MRERTGNVGFRRRVHVFGIKAVPLAFLVKLNNGQRSKKSWENPHGPRIECPVETGVYMRSCRNEPRVSAAASMSPHLLIQPVFASIQAYAE